MIASSASPLVRMVSAKSRWSAESGESSSRLVIPTTPFIGVRISWLIIARNWLLARLAWVASSASRRDCAAACSRSALVLTSRAVIVSASASARDRALVIARLSRPTSSEATRPPARTAVGNTVAASQSAEGRSLKSRYQRSPSTSRVARWLNVPPAVDSPVSKSGGASGPESSSLMAKAISGPPASARPAVSSSIRSEA